MIKSTIVCFSLINALSTLSENITCIPIVQPEYVTPGSPERTINLNNIKKTFYRENKQSSDLFLDLLTAPEKAILVIEVDKVNNSTKG